jgi:hypothetical protein
MKINVRALTCGGLIWSIDELKNGVENWVLEPHNFYKICKKNQPYFTLIKRYEDNESKFLPIQNKGLERQTHIF